jgi:hypothetical protein
MTGQLPGPVLAAIVIAPLVAIPAVFFLVCSVLSLASGWRRISQSYATTLEPVGERFTGQSGRVGPVSYNNCLTVQVGPKGLFVSVPFFLRPGHRPLFIPWDAVHNRKGVKSLWREGIQFDIGRPAIARMMLPTQVFRGHATSA